MCPWLTKLFTWILNLANSQIWHVQNTVLQLISEVTVQYTFSSSVVTFFGYLDNIYLFVGTVKEEVKVGLQ